MANLVAGVVVTAPEAIWVSDITYIRLHREFIYLAVVMDVFTREFGAGISDGAWARN